MVTKRFSKRTVYEYAVERLTDLEEQWRFDPSNGYAQVQGKSNEINRAYGEYAALQRLIEHFNLGE